jgi:hypothetical protein
VTVRCAAVMAGACVACAVRSLSSAQVDLFEQLCAGEFHGHLRVPLWLGRLQLQRDAAVRSPCLHDSFRELKLAARAGTYKRRRVQVQMPEYRLMTSGSSD